MSGNAYGYGEIREGQTECFRVEVTAEKMELFEAITGDQNPLHLDDGFARQMGYDGRVAYGMLTAFFYSTLAGMYLPGRWSLIHSVEAKFLRPVCPGDELTVAGTVREKNDTFRLLTIKAEIRNQKREKVSGARMKVGVLHE